MKNLQFSYDLSRPSAIPRRAFAAIRFAAAIAAFALLAEAFTQRGHVVRQTQGGETAPADLVIANRVPRLFARLPKRGRRVLWLHNPAGYLRKPVLLLDLLESLLE